MRKPLLTVAMALAMLTAGAQINSPQAAGYLDRGVGMELTSNYLGSLDQLTHLQKLSPDATAERQALYYKALSAFERYQPDARQLLEQYLAEYPASGERMIVSLAIADCDFRDGNYAVALKKYNRLSRGSYDEQNAASLSFHKGFCLLKVGDYDKASAEFGQLVGSPTYGNAARFYQGYAAYAKGDLKEAEMILTQVDTHTSPGNMADAYLAQIYYRQGNSAKALAAAKSLLNSPVEVPEEYRVEAMRIAGESLYQQGDLEAALKYLNDYVANVDEPQPSTLYILGLTQYRQGKYEEAVESLTTVTTIPDAMGQSAYLLVGQSYMKLNNINAATMAFDKAAKMDFDRNVAETAFYNYAIARTSGGRVPFGSGVATFEEFLQRYPDSKYAPEVQDYIVTGYLADNDYEAALQSILKIKKPTNATLSAKQQILYTLGTRDYDNGDLVKAEDRFRQAKAVGNYNPEVVRECDLWIGDCLYGQGKFDAAAAAYLDYINAAPATSANRAMAYYNLGYARFQAKKYQDAATDFQRYIDLAKGQSPALIADAYNRIGDSQYYSHEFEAAAASYTKAYDEAPEAGDYSIFQQGIMAGSLRKYKAKVEAMNKVIDNFPNSPLVAEALLEKAQALTELNDRKGALVTYRQLASAYPSTEQGREGLVLLGVTQMALGNKADAIETYRQVITDYPTSQQAQLAVDNLKEIYAADGNLPQLATFLNSVAGAPQINPDEMELLTFEAAEQQYNTKHTTDKLQQYVASYPNGKNAAKAYEYLLRAALDKENDAESLKYATIIVERFPHSQVVEDALLIKGDIEFNQGKGEKALATYTDLEQRASTPDMQADARMGMLRVNASLGRYNQVIDIANRLLSTAATNVNRDDVLIERGIAYMNTNQLDKALADLTPLSKTPTTLNGSKAAYTVGQIYFDQNRLPEARKATEKLIDSNTPYYYWLARGFILMSDITRKEGDAFEADEYLRQLRANYPGDDDIKTMIDQRLK